MEDNMLAQEHDKLASLLFPDSGVRKLVNLKLFRGDADVVKPDELREEVRSALVQVWKLRTTKGSDVFVEADGFKPVDIATVCS
jgi:hypothetical protein